MTDQVHPASLGQLKSVEQLVDAIGWRAAPPADRIAEAFAANSASPHLVEPRAVESPRLYDEIMRGEFVSEGDGFIDLDYFPPKPVKQGDIVMLGYGGPLFTIPPGGNSSPIGQNTRLRDLGVGNPPPITGGTVMVVRRHSENSTMPFLLQLRESSAKP
jgi:hypothetical protein